MSRWNLTFYERFIAKVDVRSDSECWEWTGSRKRTGYGQFHVGERSHGGWNKPAHAHRVSYELFVGPIPDGLHIDHLCRNRACVNPRHLEVVTPHENTLRGKEHSKTHCIHGHEYTPENTMRKKGHPNRRGCRACQYARNRDYKLRTRHPERWAALQLVRRDDLEDWLRTEAKR